MKRKTLYSTLAGLALSATVISCDYLDIVPVEQATLEDAYQRPEQTLGYLYSCYSGLKSWNPVNYQNEDVASTDEYVLPVAGNWCLNAYNIQTNSVSPATGGDWHWRYCGYDHIRICHLFMEALETAPRLTDEQRKTWRAEALALMAYYHFMVLRKYGPCPIMDKAYPSDVPSAEMPGRAHYDKVTQFIVDKLDEAMPDLPDRWTGGDWGRIDKVVAKAIKARVLVYAASPLWNGNTLYESGKLKWENNVSDPEYGTSLVSAEYSREKWERARTACQEALDFALSQGLELYHQDDFNELKNLPEGTDKEFMKYVFRMRYALLSRANATGKCQELVWGTAEQSNIAIACMPRRMFVKTDQQWLDGWSGVAPTLNAIKMFYTKNGKPITIDKEFPQESEWFKAASDEVIRKEPSYSGQLMKGEIINLHTFREPRFYAWMAFNGGEFGTKIIQQQDGKQTPIILQMRNKDRQGYNPDISMRDYCRTGYLCQKWIHPDLSYSTGGSDNGGSLSSPRPLIRMAELYLNLAECEAALNNNAGFLKAINPVRERAGIPELEETDLTQNGMTPTEWVRNERFIEFYGEGIRYYDIRRWMEGKRYYGCKFYGLDMVTNVGPTFEQFNRPVIIHEYENVGWDDRMYLRPLFFNEVDKTENMVQVPGY